MNDFFRNSFKVVFNKAKRKITYHVDEKNKSVKCFMTFILLTPDAYDSNQIICNKRMTVTGYSKCDDGDKFDVETGKKLALIRAEENAYLKALHIIKKARKDAENFIQASKNFEKKAYKCMAKKEDVLDAHCLASHPKNKCKKGTVKVDTETCSGSVKIPINRK
jgi:hypothetical protein